MTHRITRRSFLHTSAAGLSATLAAPAILPAQSPNETVRIAGIGVGGKGWTDINAASEHADVIAFCDVDTGPNRRGGFPVAAEKWPQARRYTDWRELLDAEHRQLDGVTVSTPDHMHAPVTMTAMQLGLSVYTQKPLTRTVAEARALTLKAAETGVSTQMGNQGHSGAGYRSVVAIVQSGILGKISGAHTWSNRPIWPQGLERPAGSDPIPEGLDWDLWLGVAQHRPYKHDTYHPFKWRGWYDFGAGALGDMGCHIIDPVVWSLELGAPLSVQYEGPTPFAETFPEWEVLTYRFPGTKYTQASEFEMTWSDGGRKPSTAGSHLADDFELPDNGVLIIGDEGTLLCKHGSAPEVYPQEKFRGQEIPSAGELDHYGIWVDGIRTGEAPNSSFAYAGPLTETVLLGVIASRVGPDVLYWDAENMKFTNSAQANTFIHEDYRGGWEVTGLS